MKKTHGRNPQLNRETLFHRLPFALCLALLFIVQVRLNAAPAPAPPSTAAFLATLADKPPCEASGENAPTDIPLQTPDPTLRVLYPDCGNFCSVYQCQGGYYQESCLDEFDQPGRCVPKNVVCPNEPFHSPCWCKAW
jgi:hypothetical protein